MTAWRLEPETHTYKRLKPDGKWTSCGAGRSRLVSVTRVLGSDDSLQNWAVGRSLHAADVAMRQWYDPNDCADDSLLSFLKLVHLTGLMPDQIRDAAARRGTDCHTYLAAQLMGGEDNGYWFDDVPYGFREAIDAFIEETGALALSEQQGLLLERAVGDAELGVAGTYDAVVLMNDGRRHRIDLKSSRSAHGDAFAQLASYEHLATACGEPASDCLTIVHIRPVGTYELHTIDVGSVAHRDAFEFFMAKLAIHRLTPKLKALV